MLGSADEAVVSVKACIFGKSGKELTKYHERLNQVAGDICVDNLTFVLISYIAERQGEATPVGKRKAS